VSLTFSVLGTARPQGSKRHVGGGRMVEMGKDLKPWRSAIGMEAANAMTEQPWTCPVRVKLTFFLIRPKGHFGTGRNALTLKPSAPRFPSSTPDLDKLVRAVLDALTGIAFRDDGQVQALDCMKLYADEHYPGVVVEVVPRGG